MNLTHTTKKQLFIPALYIAIWILTVLLFWIEPTRNAFGVDGYFVFCLIGVLGIIIPFILSLFNAIFRGVNWLTFATPVFFGIGELINYLVTLTAYLWTHQGKLQFAADMFFVPLVFGCIGSLLGLIIHSILAKRKGN